MLYFIKLAIDSIVSLLNTPIFMGYGIKLSGANVIVFVLVLIIIKKIFDAMSGE